MACNRTIDRIRLVFVAGFLTLLTACGQSGPLFLPEDAPATQGPGASGDSATEVDETDEEDEANDEE